MSEPCIFSYPISTLFLYFVFYSVAGWIMETTFCSIQERHFVYRGFLHGPLCPIYGVGVLLMILFFKPLLGNLVVFYLVSTVSMSAWEYFVGWFLEVTTHVKYWDYSMYRFNLKGRICLWVCLMWGVLSYVAIVWLHPPVEALIGLLPPLARQVLAIVLALLVAVDAILTIRELALMTKALNMLRSLGGELQAQLGGRLSGVRDTVSDKLTDARDVATDKLRERYNDLIAAAEKQSRRFRGAYEFTSSKAAGLIEDIKERGRQLSQERRDRRKKKKN